MINKMKILIIAEGYFPGKKYGGPPVSVKNFCQLMSEYNFNIVTEIINDNELKIISYGIQAHAAHPDLGVNAISRLIIVLDKLFKNYNIVVPLFNLFTKYIKKS